VYQCGYCREIMRRVVEVCPWCGCEGIEAIDEEDEWNSEKLCFRVKKSYRNHAADNIPYRNRSQKWLIFSVFSLPFCFRLRDYGKDLKC
jgi:hypothetical protein